MNTITNHEIWPMLLGVLLASFSLRTLPIGLALLVTLWLIRRRPLRTPIDWPVILLLLMALVTCVVTVDLPTTLLAVSRLVAGIALAYGIVHWARSPAHLTLLWLGLMLTGIVLALLTPIVTDWQPGKLNIFPKALHTAMPHPLTEPLNANMVAGALVMLLPYPLAYLLLAPSPRPPLSLSPYLPLALSPRLLVSTSTLATALMLIALLVTQSRGGLLAAAAVLWLLALARSTLALGLLPLGAAGLAWLAWRGQLSALIELLGSGGSITGLPERIEIWSRALYMIQDFPFTGIGANTYPTLADLLYPFFLIPPDRHVPHAHNLLLQVAIDLGLPGLIAFLAILIVAFTCAVRRIWIASGSEAEDMRVLQTLTWACLACLVAMLIHGVIDAATWTVGRIAFLPWAVIGILLAQIPCSPPSKSGFSPG
jgi:putative inorganic carbon (HCO3(-)) transporter